MTLCAGTADAKEVGKGGNLRTLDNAINDLPKDLLASFDAAQFISEHGLTKDGAKGLVALVHRQFEYAGYPNKSKLPRTLTTVKNRNSKALVQIRPTNEDDWMLGPIVEFDVDMLECLAPSEINKLAAAEAPIIDERTICCM